MKKNFQELIEDNRIYFGIDGNNVPRYKRFLSETQQGIVPVTIWPHVEVGHNQDAKQQLSEIELGGEFETPKPTSLIQRILRISTKPDDLILDSFAGSGTTGHAVLATNKEDGGNRKFILVEMDPQIAKDVTAERLRRVIQGYNKNGDPEKPVEGLGGGFRYCYLGTPLFDDLGDINPDVTFLDLAAHIFFSETGSPLPAKVDGTTPFIGQHRDKQIYLLFSATNQGFSRETAGNVLTPEILRKLPPVPNSFDGKRVVYAEGCTVSTARLKAERLVFKQIPYQIEGSSGYASD